MAKPPPSPNRLFELRRAAKMSRVQLSRVLDVDPATIWRWEHGHNPIPDNQKAKLAALFNVTRSELMGWDEEDEPFRSRVGAA